MDTVEGGSVFKAFAVRDFRVDELPTSNRSYESFLDVSATRRDTFELHLSRTHLAFGMPSFGHQWVDTEIAPLSWASGVVQLGHHTYNPTKGTGGNSGGGPGAGAPNTWHWDNVHISPAFPFTLLAGDRRVINETTSPEVAFPGASPDGAHLRFMGIGDDLQVSFDRGATWQPAVKQRMRKEADEHFKSYWTPIPTGVERVLFRGSDAWFGPWMVRDISIWAL